MPGSERLRRRGHALAEFPGQLGHHDIRAGQCDPAVGGDAVVGDAAVPLTGIGLADPQGRDRPPAENRGRVHRLT